MIHLHGIHLRRGARVVLDGLHLDLRAGEFLVLLGPNGAGKSTLLSVLCGEIAPERGSVRWGEEELRAIPPLRRARGLALLPQESSIDFPFTVFEVARLGRSPHRGNEAEDDAITLQALERAGVLPLAGRLYPTLSGGERQRVQLARVLAQLWEPPPTGGRCLLLDEPTSSLDLEHQHGTLRLARELAAQGYAVAAVLHDLNLAASYADRIAILERGRIVAAGTPADVLTPERIAEVFRIPATLLHHPQRNRPLIAT